MHIGFTGTRYGMSELQIEEVCGLLDDTLTLHGFTAHHGLCVGADAQYHDICRSPRGGPVTIVGHPGPDWPDGKLCAHVLCDETRPPQSHMKRNAAIVGASQIMIATPLQNEPQPRGGTWSTIRMALRALRTGKLRELHVVGRDGTLLDHTRWT